jgi:hypothetical protein
MPTIITRANANSAVVAIMAPKALDEFVGDLSSIDVAEAWNAVCAHFSRNF